MGQPLFGDCVRYSLEYTPARGNAELTERHIFCFLSYSPNPQVAVNSQNPMRSIFWPVFLHSSLSQRGALILCYLWKAEVAYFFKAGVSYNQVLKGPEDSKDTHKSFHHQSLRNSCSCPSFEQTTVALKVRRPEALLIQSWTPSVTVWTWNVPHRLAC